MEVGHQYQCLNKFESEGHITHVQKLVYCILTKIIGICASKKTESKLNFFFNFKKMCTTYFLKLKQKLSRWMRIRNKQ